MSEADKFMMREIDIPGASLPQGDPEVRDPWAEGQVAMAIKKAEAVGGPLNRRDYDARPDDHMDDMSRDIRKEDQRAWAEQSRMMEYMRRSSVTEQLASDDPHVVHETGRDFMATVESEPEFPDTHRLDMIRHSVNDRAKDLDNALDPESAKRLKLERMGLRDTVEMVPVINQTTTGVWEADDLPAELAEALKAIPGISEEAIFTETVKVREEGGEEREETKYRGVFQTADYVALRRSPLGREALALRLPQERKAVYTPEQMKSLAEVCTQASREMWVREKCFVAYIYYSRASSSYDQLCEQMLNGAYSLITSDEWRDLVSMDKTIPTEKLEAGLKMDMSMRLYALMGEAGGIQTRAEIGPDRQEVKNPDGTVKQVFDSEVAWARIKPALMRQPDYVREAVMADKDGFLAHATKNLICDSQKGPQSSIAVNEMRKWVTSKLGNDKDDNKAMDEWGWRLFRMWGVANSYDNKVPGKHGELAPNASFPTDDLAKLCWFEFWRKKEAMGGYDSETGMLKHGGYSAGPRAGLGMYPDQLVTDFMKMTKGSNGTLWQEWWEQGKPLKDLDWNGIGDSAWWFYTFVLFNAGRKEKGISEIILRGLALDELTDPQVQYPINKGIDRIVGWMPDKNAGYKIRRELAVDAFVRFFEVNKRFAWMHAGPAFKPGITERGVPMFSKVKIEHTDDVTAKVRGALLEEALKDGFGLDYKDIAKEADAKMRGKAYYKFDF